MLIYNNSTSNETHNLPVKEGYIQVTGGRVWYKIVGADKPGTPLLVLHGGPGVPHDYLEPLSELASDRPVIFYDQLGCGNSGRPGDTSLWKTDRFVDELVKVREALHLKYVHILGQSWGTMLAVEYVLRKKPAGVLSLVLSGPYLSTEKWIADQKAWISMMPPMVRDTIRKYEALNEFGAPAYQEAIQEFYKKHVCRIDPWPQCLNKAFEKMGTQVYNYMWGPSEFTMTGTLMNVDLSGKLTNISIPTLFTCGEFDEATPATTIFYQQQLPGAAIHIFKGASHSHHLENQDEYINVVRNFLETINHKK